MFAVVYHMAIQTTCASSEMHRGRHVTFNIATCRTVVLRSVTSMPRCVKHVVHVPMQDSGFDLVATVAFGRTVTLKPSTKQFKIMNDTPISSSQPIRME